MAKKLIFKFNDLNLEANEGQTVLQAVLDAGYEIPHYCYHPALSVAGSCRLCAVEVGYPDKEGNIQMTKPLVMSCQTPVQEGMVVLSQTDRVKEHRRSVMELLLINHPLDCPVCDKAGECYLQDYSFRYGQAGGRFELDDKIKQPLKEVGENILLYSDRCILCTRCVRFTREVSGGAELAVLNRGNKGEIDVFPGRGVNDKLAGNLVNACPVGALLDKQFQFKQRVWFLNNTESICPRCSRGCNITICHNKGVIWRLIPRRNDRVNSHWMCDEGRYGFKFVHADERLQSSKINQNGKTEDVSPDKAIRQALIMLKPYLEQENASKLAILLSPAASCEEQYLLARWAREISPDVQLVAGPIFRDENDETFKGGFTISAEKVPNRRGLQKILKHFGGAQLDYKQLQQSVQAGNIEALWIQGGFPWLNWCPPETVENLRKVKVLIVQDILTSQLIEAADVVLAGASWAEKSGSFINDQDLLQSFAPALEPPGQARSDLDLLWSLAKPKESLNLDTFRAEMADVLAIKEPT
jgi:NADH-quinone oxidoreductase subunit G